MNKKLLILGAAALTTGFLALTAFDGKTLEQQKAEIAQTVTMKLDEIRAAKEQECTDKINTEAQRRFDEIVAQRAAEAAAKPAKGTVKKPVKKGPSVDPLPNKPGTSKPSEDKWKPGGGDGTKPSEEKWKPANPDGSKPATSSPSKDKWGNPTKSGGGGK